MYSFKKYIIATLSSVCNICTSNSATSTFSQNQEQFVSSETEKFVKDKELTGEEVYLVIGDLGTWRFNENYWLFFDCSSVPPGRGVRAYVKNLNAWKELSSKFPNKFSMILDDFKILLEAEGEKKAVIDHCINLLKPGGALIGKSIVALLLGLSNDEIDNILSKCNVFTIGDSNEFIERIPWGTGTAYSRQFDYYEFIKYLASVISKERSKNDETSINEESSQVGPHHESAVSLTSEHKSVELVCKVVSGKDQESILKIFSFLESYRNRKDKGFRVQKKMFTKEELAILTEAAKLNGFGYDDYDPNKPHVFYNEVYSELISMLLNIVKKVVPYLKLSWNREQITQDLKLLHKNEVKHLIKQRLDYNEATLEYIDNGMQGAPPIDPTPHEEWYVLVKKADVVDSETLAFTPKD
ncbi:MAG: hypothetical protein LBQ43_01080 [Holosporales bacterium]|jgi:hypothetical protein|nr:hypothetical protein [Holosporales bacterium]